MACGTRNREGYSPSPMEPRPGRVLHSSATGRRRSATFSEARRPYQAGHALLIFGVLIYALQIGGLLVRGLSGPRHGPAWRALGRAGPGCNTKAETHPFAKGSCLLAVAVLEGEEQLSWAEWSRRQGG